MKKFYSLVVTTLQRSFHHCPEDVTPLVVSKPDFSMVNLADLSIWQAAYVLFWLLLRNESW